MQSEKDSNSKCDPKEKPTDEEKSDCERIKKIFEECLSSKEVPELGPETPPANEDFEALGPELGDKKKEGEDGKGGKGEDGEEKGEEGKGEDGEEGE